MKIPKQAFSFLNVQEFVIVSTLDPQGAIHTSAKGVVGLDLKGKVYLIDLYKGETYQNLSRNPVVTITAVDGYRFSGYSLSGQARIRERQKIKASIIREWEDRVIQRISKRVVRGIRSEKSGTHHPEAMFPRPKYLIEVSVERVVDLTPEGLKQQQSVSGGKKG